MNPTKYSKAESSKSLEYASDPEDLNINKIIPYINGENAAPTSVETRNMERYLPALP